MRFMAKAPCSRVMKTQMSLFPHIFKPINRCSFHDIDIVAADIFSLTFSTISVYWSTAGDIYNVFSIK